MKEGSPEPSRQDQMFDSFKRLYRTQGLIGRHMIKPTMTQMEYVLDAAEELKTEAINYVALQEPRVQAADTLIQDFQTVSERFPKLEGQYDFNSVSANVKKEIFDNANVDPNLTTVLYPDGSSKTRLDLEIRQDGLRIVNYYHETGLALSFKVEGIGEKGDFSLAAFSPLAKPKGQKLEEIVNTAREVLEPTYDQQKLNDLQRVGKDYGIAKSLIDAANTITDSYLKSLQAVNAPREKVA